MVLAIALLVFLLAIVFWWQLAARQKKRKAALAAKAREERSYHCVEIRSGKTACEAVKTYVNKRFLSDQAPLLPVEGCTAQKCSCRYLHFDDRRQHDRRNPYGLFAGIPPLNTGERRSKADRRKAPEATFKPLIMR